jgi:hypothetical protein
VYSEKPAISPSAALAALAPAQAPPAESWDQPVTSATAAGLAASQARLNELAAAIIRCAPGDRRLIGVAVEALRDLNHAAGFAFEDDRATGGPREALAKVAVSAVRVVETRMRAIEAGARASVYSCRKPPDAAALAARPGFTPDSPAVVYLITHHGYRAAKIGVSAPSASRLAEHRRHGWQLLAAFQVTSRAAFAIEAEVLKWWRGTLGLPPCLGREHMPQGGWTETVAAGSIDLAATATRICNQALGTR